MYRLIESIKIKKRQIFNAGYHNDRMNAARRALFGCKDEIDLKTAISGEYRKGLIKCRVIYDRVIREIQYETYQFPEIHSLKVVEYDTIDYGYKYENREQLRSLYERRGEADDIVIVKNGWVSDSYFCNLVFEKDGLLFTPSTCLLKGTKRRQLLKEDRIKEIDIRKEDMANFDRLYLINAMIDLEDNISVEIKNVVY